MMQISRTYKRHLNAADRRAKTIIEACVASGAGIEHLEDAPRFRYTPATPPKGATSFDNAAVAWAQSHCPPSGRGSIACGRGNTLKLKTWAPSRLDANPMYEWPMKGDSEALTRARAQWAKGSPDELREYLAEEAAKRRATVEPTIDDLFGEAA